MQVHTVRAQCDRTCALQDGRFHRVLLSSLHLLLMRARPGQGSWTLKSSAERAHVMQHASTSRLAILLQGSQHRIRRQRGRFGPTSQAQHAAVSLTVGSPIKLAIAWQCGRARNSWPVQGDQVSRSCRSGESREPGHHRNNHATQRSSWR